MNNPQIKASHLNIARFTIIAIVCIMLYLSYFSFNRIQRLISISNQVNHNTVVKLEVQQTFLNLRQADASLDNFLLAQDSIHYRKLMQFEEEIKTSIQKLDSLVQDHEIQLSNVLKLDSLIHFRYSFMEKALRSNGNRDSLAYAISKITTCNDTLESHIDRMTQTEGELMNVGQDAKARQQLFTPLEILLIKFAFVIVLLVAYFYIVKELKNRNRILHQLNENNQTLQRQKEFIETVQNISFNMVAVYDSQKRFISFNKKCEEELGKKASDVLGKTFLEVWPDRPNSVVYQDVQKAFQGQIVYNTKYKAISGDRYFQSVSKPVYDSTGKLFCVVSIAHEITPIVLASQELEKANIALKQQKEFVEAVLDYSVDVICVLDTELRFLVFNKKAIEVFGITEDMKGKCILDLYPKVAGSKTHQGLLEALKGNITSKLNHFSVVVDRAFESYFIPLKKDDKIYAVMLVHHDITNFVNATENLKEKNLALQRSNNELEQFAYIASHDLKEPLRKIQTFASMIESNLGNIERTQNYLSKIEQSASRMKNLVENVLDFSRVRSKEFKSEQVDLNKIIETILNDYELIIESKKAKIKVSLLPVIHGSSLQLSQLFSNLISNALKFTTHPPDIVITSEIVKDLFSPAHNIHADHYEISILDNGIGFEQKYEDQIFQIFKRLHSSNEFGGTGIGLAICHRIVNNHQGFIKATSEPGKGSKFSVYLPVLSATHELSNTLNTLHADSQG